MKTDRIDLSQDDSATLANICTVASEQYRADAKTMRDNGFPSLAQTFERQALDARKWSFCFHALDTGVLFVAADDDEDET